MAVALSWLALAVGLLQNFFYPSQIEPNSIDAPDLLAINLATGAVMFAIVAFINYGIWQGHNWARAVFAVLMILGAFAALWLSAELGELMAPESGLDTAGWILDGLVLVLVSFGPGRLWFKKANKPSPSP